MSKTPKKELSFDDIFNTLERECNIRSKILLYSEIISSIKNTELFDRDFSKFEKLFIKITNLIVYDEPDFHSIDTLKEVSATLLDSIEGTKLLKNNFLFLIEKAKSLFEENRTSFFTHLLKIIKTTNLYQQYRQIIDEMLLYELDYSYLTKEMFDQIDGTEILKNNFIAIIKAIKNLRGTNQQTLFLKVINSLELIDFKKEYLVAFLYVVDQMKSINDMIFCFTELLKKISRSKFMLDNFSVIKKGIKNIYDRPDLKAPYYNTASMLKLIEITDLIIPYEIPQRKEIDAETVNILYWGIKGSGKSKIVDTLYRITKEEKKKIVPERDNVKIDINNGLGLFFDRGIFQSQTQKYYIYTLDTSRKLGFNSLVETALKSFGGFNNIDGVIFVVDSQLQHFGGHVQSLKYLKMMASGRLIKEIPLVVMLNKCDVSKEITKNLLKGLFLDEGLWYKPSHELSMWNPIIYETCALYEQQYNIYQSFSECTKRVLLY